MLSAIAIRILALLCTPTDGSSLIKASTLSRGGAPASLTLFRRAGEKRISAYNHPPRFSRPSPSSSSSSSSSSTRGLTVHSAASDRIEKFAKRTFDLPRESVIAAVDSKENGRVTASDVARSAGIKLSDATRDLNLLASYTDGNLEVSKEGDIVYEFGPNVRTSLASRSVGLRARDAFQAVWPVLFYLTKISFGVAIFVSLAVVYGAIGVILSSSSSSDDGRSNRRGGDRGFGGSSGFSSYTNGGYYDQRGPSVFIDFNPFGNIFNAFSYRPYGYYAPYGEGERMGFLESVFSYVFGDGDPNRRRKEESLRAAARLIRDNYGVVTAEQLAPLLSPEQPPPDGSSDSIYVDESFVLDVLVALNGAPEVTDRGELVYVFPDLSITAQVAESYDNDDGGSEDGAFDELLRITGQQSRGETSNLRSPSSPKILSEEAIPFSLASDTNKFLSGALGVINLVGAIYLGTLLRDPSLPYKVGPQFSLVMKDLFPYLLTYALGYNAIPLIRSWINTARNKDIEARNYFRTLWAERQQDPNVKRKILSAQQYRLKEKVITKEKIGYSTSRDLDEQEFDDDERRQFQAFDAKMDNNDGRSSTKEDVRISRKKEQL